MTYRDVTPIVTPPEVEGGSRRTASSLPRLVADGEGGRDWAGVLIGKGVSPGKARSLAASFPAEQIENGLAYFAAQDQNKVGVGVLVRAIEEGRKPTQQEAGRLKADEWRQRLAGFAAWCHEHMPDVCGPELHLGAFQAYWRLGQPPASTLTAKHVPFVRRWVTAWDRENS